MVLRKAEGEPVRYAIQPNPDEKDSWTVSALMSFPCISDAAAAWAARELEMPKDSMSGAQGKYLKVHHIVSITPVKEGWKCSQIVNMATCRMWQMGGLKEPYPFTWDAQVALAKKTIDDFEDAMIDIIAETFMTKWASYSKRGVVVIDDSDPLEAAMLADMAVMDRLPVYQAIDKVPQPDWTKPYLMRN